MNYELAKKLKDAGFPQEVRADNKFNYRAEYIEDLETHESARIPSLSELIEACGDTFRGLIREPQSNGKISWWCESKFPHTIQNYNSPEEAVANLYMELNQ